MKRKKIDFFDLKNLLFSGIFLSGMGGTPLPPLTENHPAQKPKVVFESFPYYVDSIIEQ